MVENMKENKNKKRKADAIDDAALAKAPVTIEVRRQFRQHKVVGKAAQVEGGRSDKVKSMLSKVF